jgi:enoyl-[acyl-carrier protein] reductase I
MSYNLLKGKRGIISGALNEASIAWKIAQRAYEEGATFTLTNAPIAMRMGEIDKLAADCNAKIIGADATDMADIEKLFAESQDFLGGKIDFVLHSIGMSANIRKNRPYGDMNYDWFMKSLDVSALSLHKMLQTAEKMDALEQDASVVALSYIAAQRSFPIPFLKAQLKPRRVQVFLVLTLFMNTQIRWHPWATHLLMNVPIM